MNVGFVGLAAVILSVLPLGMGRASDSDGSAAQATPELAALGRTLFFDPLLSASGKLACATCHDPKFAYGPPAGRAIAIGGADQHQSGSRAVPSLRYLRDTPPFSEQHRFSDGDLGPVGGFTWDGRAGSLQEQASLPLLASNEMANLSPAGVTAKLARATYAAEFRRVFGADIFRTPQAALAAAGKALAAFQQTPAEFFPYSSRYDAFLRGEIELSEAEERGVELFKDPAKGNCASCHLATSRRGTPPAFTDYDFSNVGVPRNRRIPSNTDPAHYDLGLCGPERTDLRDKKQFCGFFRAPTLRNVALRDAFFHNGVFHSLREVMDFYVERDLYPEKYYPRRPDGSIDQYDDMPPGFADTIARDAPFDRTTGAAPALSGAEIDDVIAFLRTLTDGDAGT